MGATEDLFEHKFRHTDSIDGWKVGAKLECADPDKPDLVHVATVTNMAEGRVLIHFDGWSHNYDLWTPPSSPLLTPPSPAPSKPRHHSQRHEHHPAPLPAPPRLPGPPGRLRKARRVHLVPDGLRCFTPLMISLRK